jgi:hypothetical protein
MSNSNQQSAFSQQLLRRYPGVKPFETSERALFFGRDKDIEDLLDLVWLEKLVVLFGKSGYGKSSLINAGILPEIEQEAVPIVVRLGSYVAGQMPTPLDNLQRKIDDALTNNAEADFIDALNVPKTLWHQMKRKQSRKQRRFVLIFDQFEEFFTYPIAEQNAFKEQLADLLYTEVPQAIRNLNDTFTESQQTFIATPFDAKVLFAIRADRMSLLDSMKDKLPAILQKRYELRGLSEEQARQAIEKPAKSAGEFQSPTFTYSDDALRVMTQKLSETKVSQRTGIEAFQLQILCEYLEDKIIRGEIPNNRIEPIYFADKINEIYEGYYERLIEKLDPNVQHAAQLLIEEKLIFEDEKTGEARRLSVDSGVLLNEKGITQTLLNQLESTFLLRREATSTGGFNYEVSHDTMIAPILKSKSERKEIEEQERIKQVEAEKKAERIRLEEEAEREKQRNEELQKALEKAKELEALAQKALTSSNKSLSLAKKSGYSAFIFAMVALIAFGVALKFYFDSKNQTQIAVEEKIKAELAEKRAIESENLAIKNEKATFLILFQNVKGILKGNNCPPREIVKQIYDIKERYLNDTDLQNQINEILNQLSNCK